MADLYDKFRGLRDSLFTAFEAPTATVTSSATAALTAAQRAARVTATPTVTTRSVRCIIGTRRTASAAGEVIVQSVARTDGIVYEDEVLTVGTTSYRIASVEEVNPTAQSPVIWIAVLR